MRIRTILALAVLLSLAVCADAGPGVLVVINRKSPASVQIGEYYAKKRHIPQSRICRIDCPTGEFISQKEYEDQIRAPIRGYLEKYKLKYSTDYIVLTKGVPLGADDKASRTCVDSMLTVLWADGISGQIKNPYFESKTHFHYADQGMYLVTRLDGYSAADAKALVNHSLAAKAQKGLFLFDLDPNRDKKPGYAWLNDFQRTAIKLLKEKGFTCKAVSESFPGGEKGLMGYYTWGSNQYKYDHAKYVGNTYHPGAIAETIVSSSGRTFNHTTGGQSFIADLIHGGVTGVKGYISEPYATSMAHADILFDRYTSGFNLAESYYAASPFLYWKDVVIGDPLCSPFASKARSK